MNFGHSSKKKENLTPLEQKKQEINSKCAQNKGDRWAFVAILPRSGFVPAVHSAKRNGKQAKIFVEKIRGRSNGLAPLFLSDAGFYSEPLFEAYSHYEGVPYSGRGRPPHPILVVAEELKYAQVFKKRDKKEK